LPTTPKHRGRSERPGSPGVALCFCASLVQQFSRQVDIGRNAGEAGLEPGQDILPPPEDKATLLRKSNE